MTGAEAAGQLVAHTGRRPCIPAAESAVNERECDGEDSPNRDSEHDSADTQPERALHRSAHRLRRSTIRDRMQRRFERDCSRHLRFTKRTSEDHREQTGYESSEHAQHQDRIHGQRGTASGTFGISGSVGVQRSSRDRRLGSMGSDAKEGLARCASPLESEAPQLTVARPSGQRLSCLSTSLHLGGALKDRPNDASRRRQ